MFFRQSADRLFAGDFSPESFQVVTVACFRQHQVYDDAAEIEQNPAAGRLPVLGKGADFAEIAQLAFDEAGQRPELRRRTAAGPVSPACLSAGQVAACLVLVVAVWAWTCAVALASCGGALAGTDPALVACALGSVLPFALVPLALAFLLAQLGLSEDAVNACGNIGAMMLSFLGGAWVPLSMLPDVVQMAARLSPSYWVSQAVATVLHAEALTPELAAELGTNLGIVLLFAVTLFAVGLALGRARRRVVGAA